MPFRAHYRLIAWPSSILTLAIAFCGFVEVSNPAAASPPLRWESPARLHARMRSRGGWLIVNPEGIEFRPSTGPALRWPFFQMRTARITPYRLVVSTYENRRWRWPGDRSYRFDLDRQMPPSVAAGLAELVRKPVINADPVPPEHAFARIAARRRRLTGGTNGVLSFSREGIDYVSGRGTGGQSWRWADIQTLARPDPYHLTVSGYRETFDFELKEPMSRALFDRLWDFVYGRGLHVDVQSRRNGNSSGIAQIGRDQER